MLQIVSFLKSSSEDVQVFSQVFLLLDQVGKEKKKNTKTIYKNNNKNRLQIRKALTIKMIFLSQLRFNWTE